MVGIRGSADVAFFTVFGDIQALAFGLLGGP
jgi:hypothetical protein